METNEMTVHLQHEAHTDVMYADICSPAEDADIEVIEIGTSMGFPEGQVLARFDKRNKVLVGLTIQEFGSFRRHIVWKFRMASVTRAIQFLADAVRTGLQTGMPNRKGVYLAVR